MKPSGLNNKPIVKVNMNSTDYGKSMITFLWTRKKLAGVKWLKSQFGFGLKDCKEILDHTFHHWEKEREIWFPHFFIFLDEMDEEERGRFSNKENLEAKKEIEDAYDKLFSLLTTGVQKFMLVKLLGVINKHTGLNIKK